MGTRGIVAIGRYVNSQKEIVIDGSIHPYDLRRYVLYWDRIDFPIINGVGTNIENIPDLKYLKQTSNLITSRIDIPESEIEKWLGPDQEAPILTFAGRSIEHAIGLKKIGQLEAVALHNSTFGEHWSIAQSGDEIIFPFAIGQQGIQAKDAIEVALHGGLPTPTSNANLEDILKFKEKRRSELLRFRSALDILIDEIENSESKGKAVVQAIETIDRSLLDLTKALDETRIQRVVSTLKLYLNLQEAPALSVILTALGATGAQLYEFPIALGGLAGLGINASLKLGTKKIPKIDKLDDQLKDFAYLYHVKKDFLEP